MAGGEYSHETAMLSEDLEHQQLRVLLLIGAVSKVPGNGNKLDGLTKLAKLDFIARYQEAEPSVAAKLSGDTATTSHKSSISITTTPMIRYRYGPWDDRYYPVIGALVGRGLVCYTRGKRGSVAMSVTALGRKIIQQLEKDDLWAPVAARYMSVADRFGARSGNSLKEAVYAALPELMDVPLGTELT